DRAAHAGARKRKRQRSGSRHSRQTVFESTFIVMDGHSPKSGASKVHRDSRCVSAQPFLRLERNKIIGAHNEKSAAQARRFLRVVYAS
ncbi:hypothetical protein, partial [Paraburkholderia sp. Ac-20336]|uniref:hypothetical protein n=1 Tax=Paraburkholderia sp. Ac-20336 TaxID=2703886 RepID=UPI0019808749